jgi:excisionase family DNA binding protein
LVRGELTATPNQLAAGDPVDNARRTQARVRGILAMKGDEQPKGRSTITHVFEPTLTSEQAAGLLQIHPKTLQKMARKGQVPGHRIGDLWRFRASELDEWLRNPLSSKRHSCRN